MFAIGIRVFVISDRMHGATEMSNKMPERFDHRLDGRTVCDDDAGESFNVFVTRVFARRFFPDNRRT